MSDVKILAANIVRFLRQQLEGNTLTADSRESLEVGIQCVEAAFDVAGELPEHHVVDLLAAVRRKVASTTINPEDKKRAEKLKNDGNGLMKEDKFKEALDTYTKAIEIDPYNAVYFCNRAAAHFKLDNPSAAVEDCMRALAIDPDYGKAHGRMGLALTALDRHQEARESYVRAQHLEPDNESYRTNLRLTEERLRSPGTGNADCPINLGSLLQNPALVTMASEMMSDPGMQSLLSGLVGSMDGGGANAAAGTNAGGMSALLQAGSVLAQQMQSANPELVEQLRRQMNPDAPPRNPPAPPQ